MSIDRYDMDWDSRKHETGDWVDYDDHAAAIAAKDSAIEELTHSLHEVGTINADARAEIARLRKVAEA